MPQYLADPKEKSSSVGESFTKFFQLDMILYPENPFDQYKEALPSATLLAKAAAYHQFGKNCLDDTHILRGICGDEDFQVPRLKEGRLPVEKA